MEFEDELSAARASARQLVRVGSLLCGISRTDAKLLQEMVATPMSNQVDPRSETQIDDFVSIRKSSMLQEEDILVGYTNRNGATSEQGRPKSVCEKMIYWYFGWDSIGSKMHDD